MLGLEIVKLAGIEPAVGSSSRIRNPYPLFRDACLQSKRQLIWRSVLMPGGSVPDEDVCFRRYSSYILLPPYGIGQPLATHLGFNHSLPVFVYEPKPCPLFSILIKTTAWVSIVDFAMIAVPSHNRQAFLFRIVCLNRLFTSGLSALEGIPHSLCVWPFRVWSRVGSRIFELSVRCLPLDHSRTISGHRCHIPIHRSRSLTVTPDLQHMPVM